MSLNVNLTSQKIVTTKPAETVTLEKGDHKVLKITDLPEDRLVLIHVEGLPQPIAPDNLCGDNCLILPNTSGANNAEEAIRLARLAQSAGLPSWVKLEIHPDPKYLLPDPIETLKATELLVNEGFTVLPYINADPVLAKKLQDVGAATVMPLGSPIGSNLGIQNKKQIDIIIEQSTVPVIIDAGIGRPSHASEAMEMGADAVLINTAIAISSNPVLISKAFKSAVKNGRTDHLYGSHQVSSTASSTSPLSTFLFDNDSPE